jgi:hypothetical protein
MDSMNEMVAMFPFKAESEEEKKHLREEFQKVIMMKYAAYAESKIQLAGGKSFASTPNVADVMLMVQVKMVASGVYDYIDKDFYNKDAYPGIHATCEAINDTLMANEKVASYIKSRE